ncbi:MAG: serine/threonine protein kinase [Deferribacterales bacterium]|nr:serine/threonine protein kinase [Deferribacterales bacterium]
MNEFEAGQKIPVTSGGELEIIQKLGQGGQGTVYRVFYNGQEYALKWYFGEKLKDMRAFYNNIKRNIDLGAPTEHFLWPKEITEMAYGSFGYLMDLRPKEYKDFAMFLLAKAKFANIDSLINTALSISNGFMGLHRKGYSYQDLNDGNFFINPANGDVLICDNDNVAPYGENLGIAGKCRYMAPEVVVRKKLPDVHTDRFSLAVILYMLLFLNHPLEGKRTLCPCLTEELERKYYGEEPVFVWDPVNDSNRPVRGVHTNEIKLWPLYPEFVRKRFEKAFCEDVLVGSCSQQRVLEKEWQDVFINLRGLTIKCKCGSETFIDPKHSEFSCISCNQKIPAPLILSVKKYKVALNNGKKIYKCHVQYDSEDYREVQGEVVANKKDPSMLGLRNNSSRPWSAALPNGATKSFAPGEVIRLDKGVKINFGNNNIAEIN